MPELPEVEIVCRGLRDHLGDNATIVSIELSVHPLRQKMPKKAAKSMRGARILGVQRRAKYILIQTSKGTLVSHLGMTGSWRIEASPVAKNHDHVIIGLSDGRFLIYNDPRRFGMFDRFADGMIYRGLEHLGPEPFGDEITGVWLRDRMGRRQAPIKNLLMDARLIVGVGNIYASEILFRVGIRPQKPGARISEASYERIASAIKEVLREAIDRGGSSIDDYIQVDGGRGEFQNFLQVYDRAGDPCLKCGAKIKSLTLGGRSTYFCPRCQK